jgi:hypothetical protein
MRFKQYEAEHYAASSEAVAPAVTVRRHQAMPNYLFHGLYWLVIMLLVGSNLLTLTSNTYHQWAYDKVDSLARSTIVHSLARAIGLPSSLPDSPTAVHRREVNQVESRWNKERTDLLAQTVTLGAAVTAAERSYEAAQRTIQDLQVSRRSLEVERDGLKTARDQAHQAMRSHSSKGTQRVVRSFRRNVSTLAGRSIPYAGILFSVGLTGIEVREACETLKDLKAMRLMTGDNTAHAEENEVCGYQLPQPGQIVKEMKGGWRKFYDRSRTILSESGLGFPSSEQVRREASDVVCLFGHCY